MILSLLPLVLFDLCQLPSDTISVFPATNTNNNLGSVVNISFAAELNTVREIVKTIFF